MNEKVQGYYRTIKRLCDKLDELEIPHDNINKMTHCNGYQIRFPWTVGDVIASDFSYRNNYGHVESYKFNFDNGDVTTATPEDMAVLICGEYRREYQCQV